MTETLEQREAERQQVEATLRASEESFRRIWESSPLGMHMYHLEPDGRLVFVGANPAADTILGVTHTQYIGKTIEEAFPPLAETEVPERYRLAAAKGEIWQTEQIDYEDGQIKGAFEVQAFQTAPNRMIALFLDITRRKRAEYEIQRRNQELELLNAVIAALASGMELETILETVCRELAQVFDVPQVGVALLNEKKTAATAVAEYQVKSRPSLLNQTIRTEPVPMQYY
jgi:PAS domain S-box-containing protein